MKISPLFLALTTALGSAAFIAPLAQARLDETEAQSEARYGAPTPELVGAQEAPLLTGAKELAYKYEGWRVRVAFLGGKASRLEYAKIPDAGGLKKLTEQEAAAILEAEKGNFRWKEEKPRTGYAGLDALKTAFDGKIWERSDHAIAKLKLNLVLTIDSRDVEAYEKRMAKQPQKAMPAPGGATPKF